VGGLIFNTRPERPWGSPSLLYNGYRVFPGNKEGRGVTTTHLHLLLSSWKSRAIPVLPFWVRVACYREESTLPICVGFNERHKFLAVFFIKLLICNSVIRVSPLQYHIRAKRIFAPYLMPCMRWALWSISFDSFYSFVANKVSCMYQVYWMCLACCSSNSNMQRLSSTAYGWIALAYWSLRYTSEYFRVPTRRYSSVGIATLYVLDGPGIESRWGRYFPHPSRTAHPASYTLVTGSFLGVSNAEVKDRLDLYLCSPLAFVACCRVIFTFTFTYRVVH
jgi:hypothetical protein